MNGKILLLLCAVGIGAGAAWYWLRMGENEGLSGIQSFTDDGPQQLVYAGDTQERVYQMLGQPTIEFPDNDALVQWYAGYEIVLHSNVVTSVRIKPVESEEERLEKERRAELAEERLRSSYQAVAQNEQISYDAWREREEQRLKAERLERAAIEAYEDRRSSEKKAEIYAEAYRKACGCRRYHYCSRCR